MDLFAGLPQQITEALDGGSTVLTANQRSARTLHHAFDLNRRALGRQSWEPPAILSWDAWLDSLWSRLLLEGQVSDLLLSATQEQSLWRAIIAADTTTASLRPVDALAQTAASAWHLLHAYRARKLLLAYPGNADTRTFARWAAEFDRRSTRSHYLTAAQLPEALRAAIETKQLTLGSALLLVGFDSKTPAQIALLEAIRDSGLRIEEPAQPPPALSLTTADAPDETTELAACARWLRAHLVQHRSSRAAVIVPSIETSRGEIDRVFRQILAPEHNSVASPNNTSPYEFSLGVPLAHTPLVAAALDLLRWATGPIPLDRIDALLLSPYFASDPTHSELLPRAEFDAFVFRQQHILQPEASLDDLHRLASNPKSRAALPILLGHLRTLEPLFKDRDLTRGNRTHADWSAVMHELLEAAGWAVSSHLDSVEFQTRRKWESALDELATLDFDSPADGTRVSFAEARAALERIAAETLFAPESRHAPIQIMGPLESSGSSFDAVWFLRANDLAWPSTPAPNPLLPWLMQRELAMPGADPTRDAAHAQRITERIAAIAPNVVFSYAHESGEGRQRPSPALAALHSVARSAADIAPAEPPTAPIQLDSFIDDTPIPPPPDQILEGGAGILQAQAACGFRAFAEKRLFASALDPTALGLDPGERGSLVHSVLEHFWSEVKTQSALKQMPRPEREAQLNRSIDIAFTRDYARPATGWPRAYLSAERQRLLNLLHPWLDYEATVRTPFTVLSREERLSDVPIGPLRLDIRVDRIDLTAREDDPAQPQGEIILDYKTGLASPADWLGERPNQPQLPLYAVVAERPHLAAVAFANIRLGKDMGLCGYQSTEGVLPKAARLTTDSLETQVAQWREVLLALARDFHSGQASVSPKSYPETCQYCQQRLLCRLNLAALEPNALPDSEESDEANESDSDLDSESSSRFAMEVDRG
jgi:probable DNA repair protein